MQKRRRRISIFLIALFFVSSGAVAETAKVTILAEQFWPFSFTQPGRPDEAPEGISIDFATALLEDAGLEYEVRLLPWPRVMKHAREDVNQLIITLVRSASREDQFLWVGEIAKISHALYGMERTTEFSPSLEEAKTLPVSSVVGDVADDYLRAKGFENIVTTSSYLKGLEMLVRGRIDLYPGNTVLIDYQCAQIEPGCEGLKMILPLTDLEQDLYFALGPKTDAALVGRLRASFEKLVGQGRLDAIRDNYLSGTEEAP